MPNENHSRVTEGFQILLQALAPAVCYELWQAYGQDWWQRGVMTVLRDDQVRGLPKTGDHDTLCKALDIQRCLTLLDVNWHAVFRKKYSLDQRNWAKELQGVRNRWAHAGSEDFTDEQTCRALDTMSLLCEPLDADKAESLRELLRKTRYGSEQGSRAASAAPAPAVSVGTGKLPSWREVVRPHPDVAEGRYRNAEFAADLAQVARGAGAFEYRDPVEFFTRSYVTEGMAGLLEQALLRVSGKGGEPVIQLKTAFGGGKTHSLLALYHLLRGQTPLDKVPRLKRVLEAAGLEAAPKAHVAVLVGTALDPSKSSRPQNLPGVTVNTLWGEMAAQLALVAGKPSLYDIVKEADKKAVSPGSAALTQLLDAAGPCLVLMDELVAYARKLYGANGLPAGTFGNFITFIQEITEATKASKNSLVVATIPESNIEIGGEAGAEALAEIEHTFGRLESIWKPVAAGEGFEVVRRRLFGAVADEAARERICVAFSQLYQDNAADFPPEAREAEFQRRLVACYPIHPEIFDRLYEDWSTLERFQRTRGVLRLMAAVIHELWMAGDVAPMILPGSFPLDVSGVRSELTRYLPENWNAIVDGEVDGKNSVPYRLDKENSRFGMSRAARRVARTVFLGSAPSARGQSVRGIEASRVRLGVVQPGETIAGFNDALATLGNSLSYLYASSNRYWYDTRPTLRKTMEERAGQIGAAALEDEIERRLRGLKKAQPFAGLHLCPASSVEIPDEQSVRLVVLRPGDAHKAGTQDSAALTAAQDLLENRGHSPRMYRNMLAFVAPDREGVAGVQDAVRQYLAWRSIQDDKDVLNLDQGQIRETAENLKRSDETVNLRLWEAWNWLLLPSIDNNADMKKLDWTAERLTGDTKDLIAAVARKMAHDETLITRWGPELLRMQMDGLLWQGKDAIAVKDLWAMLCTYCYLPRLSGETVLLDAIQAGVRSGVFGLASGQDGERYLDLKLGAEPGTVTLSDWLVKADAATNQIEQELAKAMVSEPKPQSYLDDENARSNSTETTASSRPQAPRRCYLSAPLDAVRANKEVRQILEEIVLHLQNAPGAKVTVKLEVEAESSEGFTPDIVRVVSENCRTLKIDRMGFEEE